MIKTKNKLFGAIAVIALLIGSACGTKFNRDEIKKDATGQFSDKQKEKLKALGNEEVNKLSPQKKAEAVDVLFEQIVFNIDHETVAKQMCHSMGLASRKCENDREKCLEKVAKTDFKKEVEKVKVREAEIKASIGKFIDKLKVTAEDLIIVFDGFDATMKAMADLDCGASQQDIGGAQTKVKNDLVAKYGEAKVRELEALGKELLKPGSIGF